MHRPIRKRKHSQPKISRKLVEAIIVVLEHYYVEAQREHWRDPNNREKAKLFRAMSELQKFVFLWKELAWFRW